MKIEDRMKDFYENRSRIYLPRKNAVIIRVDGNCFSKLIKKALQTLLNMSIEVLYGHF